MKITRLGRENRYEFADMDPYMYLDSLYFPEYFALAVTEEKTHARMGLMLCRQSIDMLIIIWIYVAPEYRNRGFGEQLIRTAFETAVTRQCTRVAACIPEIHDGVFRDTNQYFSDKLFADTDYASVTWSLPVSALKDSPLFYADYGSLPYRSVAFSDISKEALRQCIDYISRKKPDYMHMSPEATIATAEHDVSTIILRDEKPCGILILTCINNEPHEFRGDLTVKVPAHNTLYATLFSVLDKGCGPMLLSEAMQRAAAKYSPDTVIRILSFNEEAFPIWTAGFPGAEKVETGYMIASVEEYLSYRQFKDAL